MLLHQPVNCALPCCPLLAAGPMLWGCLLAMIVWGFIQIFFPPGPIGNTIFALLGAFLFR